MDCNKVLDNLSLMMDGRLSALDEKQIKRHMSNCAECREEYNALKEVSDLVGSLDQKSPPEDFSAQVMERITTGVEEPDNNTEEKALRTSEYLKKAAIAAVIFFFVLGNGLIWTFNDGFMAADESENDINLQVDMRLAGPNVQVRDVGSEEEVKSSSSKELTNDAGRYQEDEEESGFSLVSLVGESSPYFIFNGMYIPVAAVAVVLLKLRGKE